MLNARSESLVGHFVRGAGQVRTLSVIDFVGIAFVESGPLATFVPISVEWPYAATCALTRFASCGMS